MADTELRRLSRFAKAGVLADVLVTCLFCAPALAQTPVPGGYAPNAASGMKAGMMGPGGSFVVENGWLFYNTDKFVDSSGNEIPTRTTNGLSNRTLFGYVTERKFLGANYNPMIIMVFANKVYGIGPEINWRVQSLPGFQVKFRAGFEFGSRNNSQGTGGVLSLIYAW